jgi:hypothetical protein
MLARVGLDVKLIIPSNSYRLRMNINLRQLQAFVGAYRLGSLTRRRLTTIRLVAHDQPN